MIEMTWCMTHITPEQEEKVIEHLKNNNIPSFITSVELGFRAVLIHSGGEIILVNAPEINQILHEAMRDDSPTELTNVCDECGQPMMKEIKMDLHECKKCRTTFPAEANTESCSTCGHTEFDTIKSHRYRECQACGECRPTKLKGGCQCGCQNYSCPECGTLYESSPDGPWCPKCHPDAPTKFHVEESETHYG